MTSVSVVGAGVIGLSTALHLLERFPDTLDLTVVSDKFSPNTTSNKAGALIFPANNQGTTQFYADREATSESTGKAKLSARNAILDDRMRKWSLDTLHKFHSLYRLVFFNNCLHRRRRRSNQLKNSVPPNQHLNWLTEPAMVTTQVLGRFILPLHIIMLQYLTN